MYSYLAAFLFVALSANATPTTKVILNGLITPVYFNDGDTFRVMSGPMSGTSARIEGFNTLESYGAVHIWGDWHQKELYFLAKAATLNARRGVWHCTSDAKRDTYGRLLAVCDDLALDQLSKGFAHVMTVDEKPGRKEYLLTQESAMRAKVGIWAHGIPNYVVTSTHSATEANDSGEDTYDRLVSTFDGHSEKQLHQEAYNDCQRVCHKRVVDEAPTSNLTESCMTHVSHQRRFGQGRASCLD